MVASMDPMTRAVQLCIVKREVELFITYGSLNLTRSGMLTFQHPPLAAQNVRTTYSVIPTACHSLSSLHHHSTQKLAFYSAVFDPDIRS